MTIHEALAAVSPRARRWRRFLRDLPLDPDLLPRSVEQPGPRDFIICGSARTGTSLLSAALFAPPHVVTVMEPWDGMRMPPAELFASIRREIQDTGRLTRGRLDLTALSEDGAVRWTQDGGSERALEISDDYLLGVKWPVFWRYLELLPHTKFLACLRHPIDVINSYAHAGGRVAQGLHYDTAFNRAMNRSLLDATDDVALRRVFLYDYIHERILPHLNRPNVLAVRYERWFTDPVALLDEISQFLGVDLPGSPAVVERPTTLALSERELQLIIERCTTAAALGYDIRSRTNSPVAR